MQKTVWLAYNTDGDMILDPDNASDALSRLIDGYGQADGVRVLELNLTLPEIKAPVLTAVLPDTDGPVTVSVSQ